MNTPWLKFYPSDWRADPALRSCSIAARGLWMEMLCVMHEATPRGHLKLNGISLSNKQLATLAGAPLREAEQCLIELEVSGVYSRDNGTIISRRMVRDTEKAEQDKANGKGGGNPRLKRVVNPPDNGEDKAQKPEELEPNPESKSPKSPFRKKRVNGISVWVTMDDPKWAAYAAAYRAENGGKEPPHKGGLNGSGWHFKPLAKLPEIAPPPVQATQ